MTLSPPPLIFEEHCTVLAEWRRRELRGKTLVYLDAHLDLQRVNQTRMQRLRSAPSPEAFSALEKPDHLQPDGEYVYGLENFLYPANQLGIVSRLVWVRPPHVRVNHSRQVLSYAQQMDGVTFDELCAFRKSSAGCYEGTLLGLPLTICTFEQLPLLEIPPGSLLDVDTDYFLALPEDRIWIQPPAVVAALKRSVVDPVCASIARSVGSGFLPLRYRYIADWIGALWTDDGASASHFANLFRADGALRSGAREDAARSLRAELAAFPNCPATHHLLALTATDAAAGMNGARAAALDPGYRYDPARLASETVNRHLATPLDALETLNAELTQPGASVPRNALVALGLAYAERGDAQRALECYRRYEGAHPALALAVAALLSEPEQRALRKTLLGVAVAEDASATSAHMQLAEIAIEDADYRAARTHFEFARRNAPAWLEPLDALSRLHGLSGRDGVNRYALELEDRIRKLSRVMSEQS
jgi:hypothetical protein